MLSIYQKKIIKGVRLKDYKHNAQGDEYYFSPLKIKTFEII